jgi:hypothetical protein
MKSPQYNSEENCCGSCVAWRARDSSSLEGGADGRIPVSENREVSAGSFSRSRRTLLKHVLPLSGAPEQRRGLADRREPPHHRQLRLLRRTLTPAVSATGRDKAHERRHGRRRATQTLRIGGAASPPWAAEEGARSRRCDSVSASEHYVRTAANRDAVNHDRDAWWWHPAFSLDVALVLSADGLD